MGPFITSSNLLPLLIDSWLCFVCVCVCCSRQEDDVGGYKLQFVIRSIPEIHKTVPFLKGKTGECLTRCLLIILAGKLICISYLPSPNGKQSLLLLHSNWIQAAAAVAAAVKEVEKCECNFSMFDWRILLVGKFNFNEPWKHLYVPPPSLGRTCSRNKIPVLSIAYVFMSILPSTLLTTNSKDQPTNRPTDQPEQCSSIKLLNTFQLQKLCSWNSTENLHGRKVLAVRQVWTLEIPLALRSSS